MRVSLRGRTHLTMVRQRVRVNGVDWTYEEVRRLKAHTRTRSWNLGIRAFVKFLVAVFGVLVVWAAGTFLLLLFDPHVMDSAPAGTTKTSAYLVSLIACAVFLSGLLLCSEYLIRHPKQPPDSYATEGRPNASD